MISKCLCCLKVFHFFVSSQNQVLGLKLQEENHSTMACVEIFSIGALRFGYHYACPPSVAPGKRLQHLHTE